VRESASREFGKPTSAPFITPFDTITLVTLLYHVRTFYIVRYNPPTTQPSQPIYTTNELQQRKRNRNQRRINNKRKKKGGKRRKKKVGEQRTNTHINSDEVQRTHTYNYENNHDHYMHYQHTNISLQTMFHLLHTLQQDNNRSTYETRKKTKRKNHNNTTNKYNPYIQYQHTLRSLQYKIPYPQYIPNIQIHSLPSQPTFMCPRSIAGVPFDSVRRFRTSLLLRLHLCAFRLYSAC